MHIFFVFIYWNLLLDSINMTRSISKIRDFQSKQFFLHILSVVDFLSVFPTRFDFSLSFFFEYYWLKLCFQSQTIFTCYVIDEIIWFIIIIPNNAEIHRGDVGHQYWYHNIVSSGLSLPTISSSSFRHNWTVQTYEF